MRFYRLTMLMLMLMLGVSFASAQAGRGTQSSGAAQGERPAPVTTAEISEKYQTISAGGRLKPEISVDHQSTASGYVLAVFVKEGQRVSAGQELFSIERDSTAGSFKPAVVSARIDGVVSEVSVQNKDEVSTGQTGVTIVGTGGFILEAAISDKDAFKVNTGESIVGHTTDGNVLRGHLAGRSIEPDYTNGLFQLTFEFPAGSDTHIGEFVMVDLPVNRTLGIFVNRTLLVRRFGKFFMWLVNGDNVLELREVKTGVVMGDEALIVNGLAAGERYLNRLTGREKEGAALAPPGQ